MWRKVMPALARTYRCIAPDLRGLGWSDAPSGSYAKDVLADDMLGLLDALGLDRVRVIGHDWGTVVGSRMALKAPERVVRFLGTSAPLLWDRGLDPRRLLGIVYMPFLSAPFAGYAVPAIAYRLLRMSNQPHADAELYARRFKEDPARRRATVGYYRTFVTRELPALVASPPGPPDVPFKCIGGNGDPVVRWSRDVELVRGAGHFLPEDKPDAVIGHAQAFL